MIVLQVTEEVKCLVVNPNHVVVVSGQGPAPHQVSDSNQLRHAPHTRPGPVQPCASSLHILRVNH